MSLAYRITGGAVETAEIPAEGLPVMLSRADLHPRLLLPGEEGEHWPALLPIVAEISARVAPWANWWWGLTIEGDWRAPIDGSDRHPGGLALARSAVIMLTTAGAPTWTVRAAYHEAFHVLDDWLTLDERRVLDAAVDRGPTWPTPYLSSRVERRARLFEGFAMYLHEGGSVIVGSRTPEARILAAAYDGTIGARILARQRQPRRLPRWLGWRGNASSTTTTVSPSAPSSLTKSRTG